MTLSFHFDAGHGWLAVPLADFPDALDFGTGFGYHDVANGTVFLEEDCEAPAFLAAHPDVSWVEVNDGTDSPIRSLPRIAESSVGV